MRFLMLNWRDPYNPLSGGAERVSLAYLGALVQRGHEVYWFANAFPGCQTEEVISGIKIVRGGGKGSSIIQAIQWYRHQANFDLVIDQHHGIPWYAPWWCKTNCVAYLHEVLGPIWTAFYSWPFSTLGWWQERFTYRIYRRVPFWTPSESTQKWLQQHGVRQVTVLPNPTDAAPLSTLADKPLKSPVKLIVVSRLAPNKRVDHAVRAVRIMLQRGVGVHLTIIGGGEEEPRLKKLVKEWRLSGNVAFTGSIPEAEKDHLLRQSHLLVHTSLREGWGLNVIEANAMGTPAVVYPVEGLIDSTIHGQTGIVVRKELPEAVAQAVEELLKTPEKYTFYRQKAWDRSRSFQRNIVLPKTCDWLEGLARRTKS